MKYSILKNNGKQSIQISCFIKLQKVNHQQKYIFIACKQLNGLVLKSPKQKRSEQILKEILAGPVPNQDFIFSFGPIQSKIATMWAGPIPKKDLAHTDLDNCLNFFRQDYRIFFGELHQLLHE